MKSVGILTAREAEVIVMRGVVVRCQELWRSLNYEVWRGTGRYGFGVEIVIVMASLNL